MHLHKHEAIRSFMMAKLWHRALRNTYTQNSKVSWKQNLFYFENALFLQESVRSEQKKVDKLLLVKQLLVKQKNEPSGWHRGS